MKLIRGVLKCLAGRELTLCLLGKVSCFFFVVGRSFFKINFFEHFFQEITISDKLFGSRSGPTFCRA